MTSVMVVDDQQLVRASIVRLLSDLKEVPIKVDSCDGTEIVQQTLEKKPDIILLDVNIPRLNVIDMIATLLQHSPQTKIIALTTASQQPIPHQILKAGARGYLTKASTIEKILHAIQTVLAGKIYLDLEIAQGLALQTVDNNQQFPLKDLSKRELEILIKVANGWEVADIALELSISPKTVNTYRYRIYEKLNIRNDVELTWFALRQGLLKPAVLELE